MRIPLPDCHRTAAATAHPYPIQVARQAQEFIQAAIFHVSLLDVAAGQRVRQPGAIQELETYYLSHGLAAQTWEESWSLVSRYKESLEAAIFQSSVAIAKKHVAAPDYPPMAP